MYSKTVCIAVLLLSGCTKIPPVTSQYYLAKSSLRVDVTRAVSCRVLKIQPDQPDQQIMQNNNGEKPEVDPFDGFIEISIADAVTPVITNSADLGAAQKFDFQELRGPFTDPDVKVQYYPDGRLMGINTIQVGQAKQILESSLNVVAAIRSDRVDKAGAALAEPDEDLKKACKLISDYKNSKTGVLALQYSGGLPAQSANTIELKPVGVSKYYHDQLYGWDILGTVQAFASSPKPLEAPVFSDPKEEFSLLTARQLSRVSIGVQEKKRNSKPNTIWSGAVLMALPNNEYGIPIPRRPAFGRQEFEVAFSESGSLETIRYASQSGTSDALGLAGTVVDDIQGPTASEEAKAIQAEADLIKQRQRLAVCRANPTECP